MPSCMKKLIAKIWVPALLVLVAGVQSFGIDASRAVGLKMLSDSLTTLRSNDSSDVSVAVPDSVAPAIVDSLLPLTADTVLTETADSTVVLTAKDTIVPPDSLKEKDPFFYKYYMNRFYILSIR